MAITVKHTKVSTVPDSADTSIVRPSDWNDTHTLTGFGTAAELNAGVANGVATLDAGGKVPTSQIPLQGDLNYQGTWNASTNSPTLTSSTGTKGYYYVVDVAGSTNLNGITDWQIGDWAIFNGSVWQKVDNTDAVTSVNGYTGTVVLTQPDIAGTANAPTNTNITSMTGVTGGISTPDYITFDTTYTTPLTAGQLGWDGNNTLGIGMAGGNVIQHIGEDQFFYCKATSTVAKGQVVMFTGAVGASGVPTGAPATGITDGAYIMGIAAENIATNGFGLVQAFGTLKNVNTTGYADGDILWYDPAVAGGLTKTKPVAPNVKVQMAAVINGGSSGGGTILIRINPGSTLGGTDSNAQINSPSNGNILTYDGTDDYWKNTDLGAGTGISVGKSSTGVLTVTNTAPDQNVSISAGTGISTSGTYPNFTVTNTAPDQTVSITGGGTTTVTGTYPNFTVSSADQYVGTVTSVAATAGTGISITGSPITSSGTLNITNTAPDQVVSLTGAGTTTISGTYPNFTVTSNDQYTGTVTAVTGTAPIASTGGTTPTISIPKATGSVDGYLSATDWTTFNNKQPAGAYLTTVTADAPLSGSGTSGSHLVISQATTSTNGYLSSTDWNTFNGKANSFTYTSTYIPYGQGTTTPNQSSSLTFDGTVQNAPVQRASNGIIANSKTVSASYTIASGDSAMSTGPITVATGQTVTVSSGSRWVVL